MIKSDIITSSDNNSIHASVAESWIRCIISNFSSIDNIEREILEGKRSNVIYQENSLRMSSNDSMISNRARIFRILISDSVEFDGYFAENVFLWAESLGVPEEKISGCYAMQE